MKILFIGDLNEYTRCHQRFRAIKELGHAVQGVRLTPPDQYAGINEKHSLLARIACKLSLPLDPLEVNSKITQFLEKRTWDLVWIEKGLMVRPNTLRDARILNSSVQIANCTEDDMYAKHNNSYYYRRGLKYYDFVFTTKSYNCRPDELPRLGARKVVFVDNSFDRHTHRPLGVTSQERQRLGADVGAIATFEKDRALKVLYLAEHGIPVRVWGNGWSRWAGKHQNLRIENKPLYGDDYIKAICATKINLCFLRKINRDLQTSRTMEIPACRGFMLAERTDEHLRLFEEDKEAVYFDAQAPQELLQKVKFYLSNESARLRIAQNGHKRCLESGYSHHDRLKYMLGQIEGFS